MALRKGDTSHFSNNWANSQEHSFFYENSFHLKSIQICANNSDSPTNSDFEVQIFSATSKKKHWTMNRHRLNWSRKKFFSCRYHSHSKKIYPSSESLSQICFATKFDASPKSTKKSRFLDAADFFRPHCSNNKNRQALIKLFRNNGCRNLTI